VTYITSSLLAHLASRLTVHYMTVAINHTHITLYTRPAAYIAIRWNMHTPVYDAPCLAYLNYKHVKLHLHWMQSRSALCGAVICLALPDPLWTQNWCVHPQCPLSVAFYNASLPLTFTYGNSAEILCLRIIIMKEFMWSVGSCIHYFGHSAHQMVCRKFVA